MSAPMRRQRPMRLAADGSAGWRAPVKLGIIRLGWCRTRFSRFAVRHVVEFVLVSQVPEPAALLPLRLQAVVSKLSVPGGDAASV
jgi:hypothetical protein